MDDHGSGTSTRTVSIAPQAWSEAPIGLIKKDSTKTTHHPCMQGRRAGALACMRRGARAGAECGQHAQPWGAGFWAAGARALGAGAGFWPACACLHSRGGRRGSAQAAERIARAGTERLVCGRKAQASTGFGLHAHDCARVSVLVCRMQAVAGHRQARASSDTRPQSGLFSLV